MFIQTAKRRIAPPYQEGVMEQLLNNARGPVAKMNGTVAQLRVHRSWEEDDKAMRGRNVQDRQMEGQNAKNKEYDVISEIER